MNPKQWAEYLNGREYGSELSREEESQATKDGVLIVYGYSDDNVELRGLIDDEIDAWEGRLIRVDSKGVLRDWESVRDRYSEKEARDWFRRTEPGKFRTINAEWSKNGYAWLISIDCEFETFDIMQDGQRFCRGIAVAREAFA